MDVSAVVVGKNVRKLLNLLFLVFVLTVPVQAQDGLSLESLAAILESQYDAIDSLHYEYTQTGKLLEPDIKQYVSPGLIFPDIPAYQFQKHMMWVTDGKIRYDSKHGVSEDNLASHFRRSWNGERKFTSSDQSGTISSGFGHGELRGLDPFASTGFLLTRVTGYFDRSKVDMASVKGLCPLARIQSEFDRGEEGMENPYLIVDDETVNGKRYVVLKEHYPDHKNPRWAYYFDPEKSYAMVRMVRWADYEIGDAKTSEVKVELQEVNGIFVPRRVDITYYGAYFSFLYNKLPKTSELYAMPVMVWSLTMEQVEVNEAIDPDTFEAASIFDDGMWVLDIDADISFKWGQADKDTEDFLSGLTEKAKPGDFEKIEPKVPQDTVKVSEVEKSPAGPAAVIPAEAPATAPDWPLRTILFAFFLILAVIIALLVFYLRTKRRLRHLNR